MNQQNFSTNDQENKQLPKESTSGEDILRRAGDEGNSDELSKVLSDNWQKIVATIVLLVVSVWVFVEYKAHKNKAIEDSSYLFSQLRDDFISSAPTTNNADSQKEKFFEYNLKDLNEKYSGSAYANFANLYAAQKAFNLKDYNGARNMLAQYEAENYLASVAETSETLNIDSIAREFAALIYIRADIEENGIKDKSKAFSYLKNFVSKSNILTVEAFIFWYKICETQEEKDQVTSVAKQIIEKRPEISGPVTTELENLGAVIQSEQASG